MGKKDQSEKEATEQNPVPEAPSCEALIRGFQDAGGDLAGFDATMLRAMTDDELKKLVGLALDANRYLDLARRTQADFDNYQKRAEKQRRDDARFAIVPLVRELVVSIENLDRALVSAGTGKEFETFFKGVGMTRQILVQTLEKFGVHAIEAKGASFDPEQHEAVMTGEDPAQANDIVLDCLERGWRLQERVIKPAKVRVNKPDNAGGGSNESGESPSGKMIS